jgi:phosphohistidine swiveling domain-containing protein
VAVAIDYRRKPSPLVTRADTAIAMGEQQVGGKAKGLARLNVAGARVPPWFSVTADEFLNHLAQAGVLERIRARLSELAETPELDSASVTEMQGWVRSLTLDPDFTASVGEALQTIGPGPFAVRSSMVGEDSTSFSFAGQLETFLYQRTLTDVVNAIRACWASALAERVLVYRQRAGLGGILPRMAVVVQRMISGQVSGVAFSAHPVTGVRNHVLITAAWGLGEAVVSGFCNADDYTCTHDGDEVNVIVANKDIALMAPEGDALGTMEVTIDADKQDRRCLSTGQVQQLAREVCRISDCAGLPQDIEWTLADSKFYLLQSRPITQLPAPENTDGPRIVFDNSNIQESYCGVTTPLTFSFAARAYHSVYNQTMRVLGFSESGIARYDERHRHLLGLIRGRVYYNINNWYEGLLHLPGFGRNKKDMEQMMGLSEPVDLVEDLTLSFAEKLRRLPRLVITLIRLLNQFRKLEKGVPMWLARFDSIYTSIDRSRFADASFSELMAILQRLDDDILEYWHTPIINDFAVMMSNGRLRRLLAKSGVENLEVLIQNLMGGEHGIESTEPTRELLRIAGVVRQYPALVQIIRDQKALVALDHLTDYPDLSALFTRYIDRYGDRAMGELKLETISLREDPGFLIQMLRNYLDRDDLDPDAMQAEEKRRRTAAENTLYRSMGFWARRQVPGLLKAVRVAVKNRENMRLARTRAFGLARDLYRALGQRLAEAGELNQGRDIFYLTVEELRDYFKGRAVTTDLRGLTALRRSEFARYETADLPHQFQTIGAVYFGNRYQGSDLGPVDAGSRILTGTGCYPGTVEARLKVIRSPRDNLSIDGQILVAMRTDPGWAPLFPTCTGILVERGSTLSHSAVIARELGIPAVVGVPRLLAIVKDGERVRLDGGLGSVERLDMNHEEKGQGHE